MIDHWADASVQSRVELTKFIAAVERAMPHDLHVQSVFSVVQSLVILGEPYRALDRIEALLSELDKR